MRNQENTRIKTMSNITWSNQGHEANTVEELIKDTAIYAARCGFVPEKYLMISTLLGEIYAGDDELKAFNDAVEVAIEEIESSNHRNRSDGQKWDDHRADCADDNWKERD